MAELGQTGDPRALVPGSPEMIEADADSLTKNGQRAEQVGQGLKRVTVSSWTGEASTRFAESFGQQPPKWFTVSDSIHQAACALTGYARTLRWAQSEAGAAAQLWAHGAQVTAQAQARYRASVAAAQGNQIAPFTDPGEQLRKQAREQLTRARQQLAAEGAQTVGVIGGQPFDSVGKRVPGAMGRLVDGVTGGWTTSSTVTTGLPDAGVKAPTVGQGGKLAEIKAYAQLGQVGWAGDLHNGSFDLRGKIGLDVGAAASASASADKNSVQAKVAVSAGANVAAEAHANVGDVGVYGRASGFAGMDASAGAKLGTAGVNVNAGAFAGIKGKVAYGFEVAGISIGATAEGQLGAGAEAKYGFEKDDDGKFHLEGEAGAALGAGGKGGVEITVDPDKVAQSARDAADAIGRGARAVEETASDVGQAVEETATEFGREVEDAARDAGSAISRALG